MRTLHAPKRHVCDGLTGRPMRGHGGGNTVWQASSVGASFGGANYPDGAVAACQCGRTWVAGHTPGLIPAIWRPEGRFERWRRERKERRAK